MATIEDYEAYHESLTQRGFPATFEKAYNDLRDATIRGAWQSLMKVAATSFGKAVIIGTLAAIALPALGVGLATAVGALTTTYTTAAGATAAVGVGGAMLGGASIGLATIAQGGWAAIGALGVVSAGLAYSREKKEVEALKQDAQQRIQRREVEAAIEKERSHSREREHDREPQHARRREDERDFNRAPTPERQEKLEGKAPPTPEMRERDAKEPVMQMAHDPDRHAEQTTFRERFDKKERPESFVAAEQQRRAAAATFPPGRSDVG